MEEEVERMHTALDASKARSAVLSNENRKYRGQVKVLLDKTATDDELLDALRAELEQARHAVKEAHVRAQSSRDTGVEKDAYERLLRVNKDQLVQIERQQQIVGQLRAELEAKKDEKTSDIVHKAEAELENQEHAVNIQLLQMRAPLPRLRSRARARPAHATAAPRACARWRTSGCRSCQSCSSPSCARARAAATSTCGGARSSSASASRWSGGSATSTRAGSRGSLRRTASRR